ncbi:putative acyltransferase [Smittium culicis]|uniref:Putative acyltransferase n=1 Tax=Smittium culicis TaxID=133412 RepID=A0A1R1XST0_9FUNG|nr:putative acyltransferase [Smittium culicis]
MQSFFGHLFGLFIVGTMDLFCPYQIILSGKKSTFNNISIDGTVNWFDFATTNTSVAISNHQIYSDWLYIWALGYFKNYDYFLKFVAKEGIRKIPVFGRALGLLDFLFLKRSWNEDKDNLKSMLDKYNSTSGPKFVTIFPEGTTVNPKFMKISTDYATANNLKPTKHVLLPKTSGAYFIVNSLRNSNRHIYNFTIGYSGLDSESCPEYSYPIFGMFSKGIYPRKVHIHIERLSMESEIPHDEDGFNKWLLDEFYKKDKMLSYFYKNGKFPGIPSELSSSIHLPSDASASISNLKLYPRNSVEEQLYSNDSLTLENRLNGIADTQSGAESSQKNDTTPITPDSNIGNKIAYMNTDTGIGENDLILNETLNPKIRFFILKIILLLIIPYTFIYLVLAWLWYLIVDLSLLTQYVMTI